MARVLIVGGGGRGRRLGGELVAAGQTVRITTRTAAGRDAIEAAGCECFVADPDRVATLRYALERVAIVCWLLGRATDPALHGSRLEAMLGQLVDTGVRGVVYEACGSVDPSLLAAGAGLVAAWARLHAVPFRVLAVDTDAWPAAAHRAIAELLDSGA